MFYEFPTKEEWLTLVKSYPFENLEVPERIFKYNGDPNDTISKVWSGPEIFSWIEHLENRLAQVRWSYVMTMFYFSKGIPDDEWFISPGRDGVSIEYFPHFSEKDHYIKSFFDYFADVFYYKLFSAWDTLGHLLNVTYELGLDRASFDKAFKKLKSIKPVLFANLNLIVNDPNFYKMRELRHNITHNHLPGHIGSTVRRVSKNMVTFGGGSYTPSALIKENMSRSLDLFAETLKAIEEQNAIDNPS